MMKNIKKIVIITILLCGLGITLHSPHDNMLTQFTRTSYSYLIYPLLYVNRTVITPIERYFKRTRSETDHAARAHLLEQENELLRAQVTGMQATIDFSSDIKEIVEFRKQFDELQGHIASILLKRTCEQEHYVLVDRGARHGIEPDMVAIYKNCLLGRVSEVYPLYSKIVLVSDKSCKVAAYCGTTRTHGIHVGNNATHATLQRVNHLADINHEDAVYSSGEGLVFPRGFLLGFVEESSCDGIYKTAHIKPACDITSLNHCIILNKGVPQAVFFASTHKDAENPAEKTR